MYRSHERLDFVLLSNGEWLPISQRLTKWRERESERNESIRSTTRRETIQDKREVPFDIDKKYRVRSHWFEDFFHWRKCAVRNDKVRWRKKVTFRTIKYVWGRWRIGDVLSRLLWNRIDCHHPNIRQKRFFANDSIYGSLFNKILVRL